MKKNIEKQHFISVIVPTYNSVKKIEKLLNSLDEQTYNKFEIIFVDDGSSDGTIQYLEKYIAKKRNARLLKQQHAGPGVARKKGFEESKGNLIWFIDSDDWIARSECLSEIDEIFSRNEDIDLCITDRIYYPTGKIASPFDERDASISSGNHGISLFSNRIIVGNMSSKIFKRDLMSKNMFVGGFSYEDLCTTYLYLDKCKKIYYDKRYFYVANRGDDNISLTKTDRYKKESLAERAKNVVATFSKIESQPIKLSFGSVAFGVYCNLLRIKQKSMEEKILIRRLRDIVCSVDLSGFRQEYSWKRKFILRCIKHVRLQKNEN